MRISHLLATGLALLAFDARADTRTCETHASTTGSFAAGRQFFTWDVVPDVAPAEALRRIQAEGLKSGLKVGRLDPELGSVTLEQTAPLADRQVTLPVNVLVEGEGDGARITVSKTLPAGYATREDLQRRAMCAFIDAARG
ncbi:MULTISPECIES: hypothetical protein [Stenotrophomonas]|uniref:hypothetical protein n=1 Tax=Stenotrophomonas TaxID=40323 RepID=UPI0002D31C39|nr:MULTISPECIES: hypothetical protein [Stenotrophomonas]